MLYSRYQRFRGTYCLPLQSGRSFSCFDDGDKMFPLRRWYHLFGHHKKLFQACKKLVPPAREQNVITHRNTKWSYTIIKKLRFLKFWVQIEIPDFENKILYLSFFHLNNIRNWPHETAVLQNLTFKYLLQGPTHQDPGPCTNKWVLSRYSPLIGSCWGRGLSMMIYSLVSVFSSTVCKHMKSL